MEKRIIEADPRGTRHDAETEINFNLRLVAHDEGECEGAPLCEYCLDAERLAKESLGG